jgi:molybdopterin/thiamine biosynthesis adenylyltransferase
MKASCTRHQDIIPYQLVKNEPIHIIGAGAIGSWTALSLVKMGFENISVYDFDDVSEVNIGNQIYGPIHVGKSKAEALTHIVKALTGVGISAFSTKITENNAVFSGIVIVAVDNMATRKLVYDTYKKLPTAKCIIDPRMGAENILLYRYSKDNWNNYSATLYSDDSIEHVPCTAKATVYTAGLIAGLVCKAVKDVVTGQNKKLSTVMWNVKDNEAMMWNEKEGT